MKKLVAFFTFILSGFISYVAADVTAPAGRFLQIRQTLQPGSTVYFSSGTVQTYLNVNGIMSLPHSATAPPADCDTEDERGRIYIDTNTTSGRQLFVCEGTLGWILQGDGGSGGGSGTTILLKDGGSSIVNTSTINFTGDTFVVTNSGGEGLVALNFSSVPSRSDVILNQNSLQSGATFFVSSGTVSGQLSVLQIKFPDGTVQVSSPVAGAGTSPAGSNGNVQFNNAGAFGGVSNFNFDRSSNTLSIVGTLVAADLKDGILIISTSPASSSPGSGMAWNYPNFTGSTQTVFRIIPSQSASDTSTSTLVGFYVRGDNLLEEVMRIGEPNGSAVPHVVFPATGTRIQLTAGSFGTAYIEANGTSGDLVISPTSSANRIRLGDGAVGTVLLLFDTASNDGNVTWDGTNDVFQVSDDLQLQAQNEARFADSDSSNYVGFKAAGSIGTNRIWELPSADGTSGQAITTNGSGVLSFATISGGGGGASALEVFSNFDGTRSSPTASIATGDTLKLTVSGSTAIINVDPANVILSTNGLQSGATFYVSSGTVAGNITLGSATISGWSVYGVDNDYIRIGPRSSGVSLRVDRTENEINVANATSASPVIIKSQNSGGSGTISYTGATNGYAVNSHVGLASGKALRLYDTVDSNYVALKASSTISQTNTYILPASSGTAGQAILTDGSNNLYFGNVSGGGSGTTIRVENQGSFAVNSSTMNFGRGLIATNDAGEAKVELDPTTYVGSQVWSDGASDPTITVTYAVAPGVGPEWSYTDDQISTLNDLALPDLTASRPLKLDGSQVIVSAPINLADTTNEVTGVLPAANLGSGSTNYIQNRATLQTGATFYVSSGTAVNFNSTSGNIVTLLSTNTTVTNLNATNATITTSLTTNMFANFGSPYLVPYLDASNKFTTNANFFFADFAQILYGPSILATTEMGAYNGASIVAYDNDSSNFVKLKSSATLAVNNTYVLPASSGTSGQAILTDGANNLYFGNTMTSGSTFYIQNTNSLQSGATFYVSSGTVSGNFSVYPSSNGRTNYLDFNTTFADDFFDSKYLNQRAFVPITDGSYGGLGYRIYATTIPTAQAAINNDPTITLGLNASGNSAALSAGAAYFQAGPSNIATFTNGTDIVGIDGTNGTYVSASSFTVFANSAPGNLRIRDNDGSAHYAVFKASNSMSADVTLTLPSVQASTSNQVMVNDGLGNLGFKDVRRAMKFSEVFNAEQAKLPGSNPCVISNSTAATIPSLLCDASTDESASWSTILTEYTTTTMRANIYYTMVSTNSGAVVHNIQVMCASTTYSADLDTESFGSVNASTITVPSSIGRVGVATVTVTAGDSCGSNDLLVLKYTRDANASADTATGDIEIRKIWLFEP